MITHKSVLTLFITSVILILISCASQGKLSGGGPDEDPPLLDIIKSDGNLQTNYRPINIELHFDEFLKLSNPAKEIVVSPPLNYPLLTKIRGKKLTLSINEKDTVLVIDDLIATGGTADAAAKLIEISKGKVAAFIFVINLFDLGGSNNLINKDYKVDSLINFPGH